MALVEWVCLPRYLRRMRKALRRKSMSVVAEARNAIMNVGGLMCQ
jgi:hypothetical protein